MSVHWFHFRNAVAFKVAGKDARRYLNNRLSNDLRSLGDGQSVVAAALTAQGRVEALFTVFVSAADVFYLVSDGGNRQALFAAVTRFVVADRVSVEDISTSVAYLHISGSSSPDEDMPRPTPDTLIFSRRSTRLDEFGVDVLCVGDPEDIISSVQASLGKPLGESEYRLFRIKHGTPVFPDEVNDQVILTECGLREAVSFSKGCYVGQEVIERIDAIGKLPRSLARVRLSGAAEAIAGAVVTNEAGEALGKALSAAYDPQESKTYTFALLRSGTYSGGQQVMCNSLRGEIISG
jgi:folate-binding protein YgfZ